MRLWQVRVHGLHHGRRIVRAGNRQDRWVRLLDYALFCAQTAGDDDAPVFCQRLADGVERLGDRGVDEAAGVDDDQVGAGVVGRGGIALGAQLRKDALGVDERFRTA